jgi:parallel beta-helix repeat protein
VVEYPSVTSAFNNLESGDTLGIYGRHVVEPVIGAGAFLAPLQLANKTNIVIQGAAGAEIYGEGPGNNPGAGQIPDGLFSMILLRGTNSELTISRCRFVNYGNHGISHLWNPKVSSHVRITECVFRSGGATNVPGLGFDGAAVSGLGSYWTIQDCTVVDCIRGIEIENGGDNVIEGVRIVNNTLIGVRDLGVMLFASNSDGNKFTDIEIAGNTFKHFRHPGNATAIAIGAGRRIRIHDNQVHDMDGQGIVLLGHGLVSDVAIHGNILSQIRNSGILLVRYGADFANASLTHNIVSLCGEAGIRISDVTDAMVSENTCYNNGLNVTAGGIELLGTDTRRALLLGNKCYDLQPNKTQDYGILIGSGVRAAMVHANYCLNDQAVFGGIKDKGVQTDLARNKTETAATTATRLLATAVLVNAPPSANISLQSDGNVLLSWQPAPGQSYSLEHKASLLDPVWTVLTNWPATDTSTATVSDRIATNATRYYRIRETD